jgi:hypothetical protein
MRVIARHSPKNGCLANEGEELIIGPIRQLPSKPRPHFFIGSLSGKRSKFGWIVDGNSLIENVSHATASDSLLIEPVVISLNKFRAGDAVSLDFFARGIPPRLQLIMHKVIFYSAL